MKVDSRTDTGVEGDDFCIKNEAEGRDTEEDNRKAKFPGPSVHTYMQLLGKRQKDQLLLLCFSKQNVNQKRSQVH